MDAVFSGYTGLPRLLPVLIPLFHERFLATGLVRVDSDNDQSVREPGDEVVRTRLMPSTVPAGIRVDPAPRSPSAPAFVTGSAHIRRVLPVLLIARQSLVHLFQGSHVR